jgi:hypothetical protein
LLPGDSSKHPTHEVFATICGGGPTGVVVVGVVVVVVVVGGGVVAHVDNVFE